MGGGQGLEDILGQMLRRHGWRFTIGGVGILLFKAAKTSGQSDKGSDINVGLDITMAEAESGGSFSFTFKRLNHPMGSMEAKSVTLKTKLEPQQTWQNRRRQGHDYPEGDAGDVLLTVRIDAGEGGVGMEKF